MQIFELITLIGGIMIGMGVMLFLFAIAVAYFLGVLDEPESGQN